MQRLWEETSHGFIYLQPIQTTIPVHSETAQDNSELLTPYTMSSSSVDNTSEVLLSTAVVDLISPEGKKGFSMLPCAYLPFAPICLYA